MRRILLLAANPRGTQQLRLNEEVKRIEQGLERSRRRDEFHLVVKWAVTDDDLRRALLDHEPEIVHFSGHGGGEGRGRGARDLLAKDAADHEGLAFENDSGHIQMISGESLSGLFELCSEQVKCVVLNACLSANQATAIARHIDYVIGMNKAIGDAAALKFSIGFYDAIAAGKSYELAFKFGCCAIDLSGIPEHLTPVLRKKQPGAPIPVRPPVAADSTTPVPKAGPKLTAKLGRLPASSSPRAGSPALDSREIKRASKALADYIGPMAYIIADEQATKARNLEHFYELLGSEILSEPQRKRFLEKRPR